MNLGKWATSYAERRWPIFPLEPGGKHPATPNGFKDATTDPEIIGEWWDANPNYNIGVATGRVFDVLDVDDPDAAGEALRDAGRGNDWQRGPIVLTPSGGFHVYSCPVGRNRVRFVAGADWRGLGGYVVAPPSRSAEHGRQWEWLGGFGPYREIRPVPRWLKLLIAPKPKAEAEAEAKAVSLAGNSRRAPASHPHAGPGVTPWGQAALRRAAARIEAAEAGTRNNTLSRQAYQLTELILQGHVDFETYRECLTNAALAAGLGEQETDRTIWSAVRAGRKAFG